MRTLMNKIKSDDKDRDILNKSPRNQSRSPTRDKYINNDKYSSPKSNRDNINNNLKSISSKISESFGNKLLPSRQFSFKDF